MVSLSQSQDSKLKIPDEYLTGFSTKAVHVGCPPDPQTGAVNPPIYMSSTFEVTSDHQKFFYTRAGNPTRAALEENLAALEKGKYAVITSSGMGAASVLFHLLKNGDHLLASDELYGGIVAYLLEIASKSMGIEVVMTDLTKMEQVPGMIKKNTKMMWIETPTNPMLRIYDIERLGKMCHEKGIILVVDNTFMSPYLQNPLTLGADIVMHSCTKYIGGHSDIIMGAIITSDERLYKQIYEACVLIGPNASPFDCFLALRGTKTLAVRCKRSCQTAMKLAEELENHKKIETVLYPGLKSHPGHELAKKQARGFGGMLSIKIKGGLKEATKFCENLTLFQNAVSLGAVESLVTIPSQITHKPLPEEQKKKLGLTDNLVRLSVGIEDYQDLRDDIMNALEKI